jgi:cobalt-zinc-cadmium efflux system outer membrane protein
MAPFSFTSLRFRREGRFLICFALAALTCIDGTGASAQQPITRQQAIDSALARGPRVLVAVADTSLARAQLSIARSIQNPTVTGEYTKSAPQRHLTVDLPLDFPWLRSVRVGAARLAAGASRYRFAIERAGARFDADVAYTRALAAQAHADLSRRTALEADTLLRVAVLRRDAGDASELDVQLATVTAGQQLNDAQRDSVDALSSLLELQVTMGLPADRVLVGLADSLALPSRATPAAGGSTLAIAAAQADLAAEERTFLLERRNMFPAPSLTAGFETGDPSGAENGILPIVGLSIPLPLFNQNRGPVAVARANRDRAVAKLEVARRESAAQITRAERERTAALDRADRGRLLVESANRVTAMSRVAYVEGAAGLATVIESRRTARETIGRFIDDVAAANLAEAALRLATTAEAP